MIKFVLFAASVIMLSCAPRTSSKSENQSSETETTAPMLVALSFDDGPNNDTTPEVLDILEEHKVPASFFVIGQNINESTAKQMTRAISLGCEIQNHSLTHTFMTQLSPEQIADEVRRTDELIEQYTGIRPWLFRPPYIDHNESMHQTIGHTFICGVGCLDWEAERSAQQRFDDLMSQVKDGDIILLHENEKGIYGDTAKRCTDILSEVNSKSLGCIFDPANFVQCSEDVICAWNKLKDYIKYLHIKDSSPLPITLL